MYQRLFAGSLLAVCAVLGWMAWGLEAPFPNPIFKGIPLKS